MSLEKIPGLVHWGNVAFQDKRLRALHSHWTSRCLADDSLCKAAFPVVWFRLPLIVLWRTMIVQFEGKAPRKYQKRRIGAQKQKEYPTSVFLLIHSRKVGFLTIHEAEVNAGESHRRGGLHIDCPVCCLVRMVLC